LGCFRGKVQRPVFGSAWERSGQAEPKSRASKRPTDVSKRPAVDAARKAILNPRDNFLPETNGRKNSLELNGWTVDVWSEERTVHSPLDKLRVPPACGARVVQALGCEERADRLQLCVESPRSLFVIYFKTKRPERDGTTQGHSFKNQSGYGRSPQRPAGTQKMGSGWAGGG
jgi:hypothetical protein